MKVIGYINNNNYYPSPLIIIVEERNRNYAIFPSGEEINLEDNVYEVINNPRFQPENEEKQYISGSIAFGIAKNIVFIDTPEKINDKLHYIIENDSISKKSKQTIEHNLREEYIQHTNTVRWDK